MVLLVLVDDFYRFVASDRNMTSENDMESPFPPPEQEWPQSWHWQGPRILPAPRAKYDGLIIIGEKQEQDAKLHLEWR